MLRDLKSQGKHLAAYGAAAKGSTMINYVGIGRDLLDEAAQLGVEVCLNALVLGIYENRAMNVVIEEKIEQVRAERILIATGASENMLPFPDCDLPGLVANEPREMKRADVILNNSFGMLGINSVVIIKKI